MTWLEKRKDWTTSGGRLRKPREETRPKRPPRKVTPQDEPLWTVADIARVLTLHEDTVYKLIGNMPPGAVLRVGQRTIRIKDWAVQQLVEDCQNN